MSMSQPRARWPKRGLTRAVARADALPVVYTFDGTEAMLPLSSDAARCYVPPLAAHYLGDACVAFNALDADGSGALDAEELAESDLCGNLWGADEGGGGEGGSDEGGEGGGSCGERLLAEADGNNDGFVDFNEFMTWSARQHARGRGEGGGGAGAGRWRVQ